MINSYKHRKSKSANNKYIVFFKYLIYQISNKNLSNIYLYKYLHKYIDSTYFFN